MIFERWAGSTPGLDSHGPGGLYASSIAQTRACCCCIGEKLQSQRRRPEAAAGAAVQLLVGGVEGLSGMGEEPQLGQDADRGALAL